MNVFLVSIADVTSREHSGAVTALKHQLLVVFGYDVSNKELLVLKHLKCKILRFDDFIKIFYSQSRKSRTGDARSVDASDNEAIACFCMFCCRLDTQQ